VGERAGIRSGTDVQRQFSIGSVATIRRMTKAELIAQVESMTEEEAAEVKLIYAPDWPSSVTSIEEARGRTGTRAMTPDE
jgi:hypothetical protein